MIQYYIGYLYQISVHQNLFMRPAKKKSLKDEQEKLAMPSDFQKAFTPPPPPPHHQEKNKKKNFKKEKEKTKKTFFFLKKSPPPPPQKIKTLESQ